jgi:hypothetical protein
MFPKVPVRIQDPDLLEECPCRSLIETLGELAHAIRQCLSGQLVGKKFRGLAWRIPSALKVKGLRQ